MARRFAFLPIILVAVVLQCGDAPRTNDHRFVGRWRMQLALGPTIDTGNEQVDDAGVPPRRLRTVNAHLQFTLSINGDGSWNSSIRLNRSDDCQCEGRWDSVGELIRLWVRDGEPPADPDVWILADEKLVQRQAGFSEWPVREPTLRRIADVGGR